METDWEWPTKGMVDFQADLMGDPFPLRFIELATERGPEGGKEVTE